MPPASETEQELVQKDSGTLTKTDCLCPICLEIFLEPVTLPCTHTFCKPCFLETVDKANLCCPLCRKRVSTWARLNGRNKTLVNVELWNRIQDAFPSQCQRRLDGIDAEEDMNIFVPRPKVSQPGELRQEYEDQISKLAEEKRALEEAERRASEEYIQRLLAEEEERIAEERMRQEKWQLKEDERLARVLSQELNSAPVFESQGSIKLNNAASAKKKKPNIGQIDKFLCPVPFRNPNAEASLVTNHLANKENILDTPKTICPCPVEPSSTEMPILDFCNKPSTSNSDLHSSDELSNTSIRTNFSSKRKILDTELTDTELTDTDVFKRPCGSAQPESPAREDHLHELGLQEEPLWKRYQQEEQDRLLAQRLQRELDQEMAVDRRKGSADGYLLRQKSQSSSCTSGEDKKGERRVSLRAKAEGGNIGKKVPRTTTQLEKKNLKKSPVSAQGSPSTASPVQKGIKQTTLTEMFPNMGS